jgi:long-subunit acyl-CoA synthetase (AMP-forming)
MEFDLAVTFYVGVSAVVSKEWKLNDLLNGIDELKADLIIYSSRYEELIKEVKKSKKIDTILMNSVKPKFSEELLDMTIKNQNKVAKIVFSSGTTGKSKAVMLSLKNIFAGYASLNRRCNLSHKDSAYLFLPLNHTYAAVYNFMYSLVGGYSLYLASSTQNIGRELLESNPTVFCAVPLVFNNLLAVYKDNINMAFGKNIKYLFCGGAPIAKETRQIFKDKGLFLMQAYALSETSSSLCIAYPGDDDLESVGTIFEDMDVKVDNPDKDGVGEIIVKGESVFLGYTDKSLTKRVFDDKGYFHTGDLGYIKNNKIFLKGRKKKMLLSSNGENIMAESIEEGIKKLDSNIKDVKAYIKNDKLACDIYVTCDIDADKIVETYNKDVPKYERVEIYSVIKDSIDVRLKQ